MIPFLLFSDVTKMDNLIALSTSITIRLKSFSLFLQNLKSHVANLLKLFRSDKRERLCALFGYSVYFVFKYEEPQQLNASSST